MTWLINHEAFNEYLYFSKGRAETEYDSSLPKNAELFSKVSIKNEGSVSRCYVTEF